MAHADALRAAGVNGSAPANAGAIRDFVSAITDNALWLIGTVATLAILVIGGLFFFGHTRAADYAAQDRGRRGDHRVGARDRRLRRWPCRVAQPRLRVAACALVRRARRACRWCSRSPAALLAVRAVCAGAGATRSICSRSMTGSAAGCRRRVTWCSGPLKLGAKEIARLLATIVGALADLLVPKSLVRAGLDGIRWLVQLPPVGTQRARRSRGCPDVRMPHLAELRDVMTWIGVTLLPLGLVVVAGARAFLAPTSDGDSPADVLARVITAGVGLLVYDWAWGVVTELSRLLTSGLLGLPWVADGVERMLETLRDRRRRRHRRWRRSSWCRC